MTLLNLYRQWRYRRICRRIGLRTEYIEWLCSRAIGPNGEIKSQYLDRERLWEIIRRERELYRKSKLEWQLSITDP